jgi:autotransporter-associated beta strand protein
MNKQLDPRLMDRRPMRLRLLPAFLTLAVAGTAASHAAEVTYRYYRFTPTVNRTAAQNQTQISEFIFYNRGSKLDLSGVNVTIVGTPTHQPNGTEGVMKLIDGSTATKWFDNAKLPVVFDFGSATTVDSYQFATANDSLDRTPIRWTIEGSNDNTTYVLVDNRSLGDNATPNSYFTFRPILGIGGGSPLPVIASYDIPTTVVDNSVAGQDVLAALPAIVKNDGSIPTSVRWNVTGTTTGVSLTPGFPSVAAAATQAITPPVDAVTPFTIAATNTSGTAGATQKFRSVAGGSALARYIRFTPATLRSGGNLTQIGELEFFNAGVEVPVVAGTNPGGNTGNNAAEVVGSLFDGNYRTKWLNHNNRPVILDFGSVQNFDSYQLTTGNDDSGRDPLRWIIEVSVDGTDWTLADAVNEYPMPTARRTQTGILPLSGSTIEWTGSAGSDWDTSATSWVKSGTATVSVFMDGVAVIFDEDASNRDVNLTAAVRPSFVSVNNSTAPYSISGSPIAGRGGLIKRGSGELLLSSGNTFDGSVYLLGGKTITTDATALGVREATNRLEVSGGSELNVAADLSTQRRMHIGFDGGTVNVDGGVTFNKIGNTDFYGTLTKTGAGTLRLSNYAGSLSPAADDLVINEGTVEFTSVFGFFNSAPFGGTTLPAGFKDGMTVTVNSGGTLRFSIDHALGGDYVGVVTSVEQIRVIGGTFEQNGSNNYIHVGVNGSGEGKLVLQGSIYSGSGQTEPANNAAGQSTITTLASDDTSLITGTGVLTANPAHFVFAVADGGAEEDLVVTKVINGNYGIVKQGPGTMVLQSASTYNGTPIDTTFNYPDGTTVQAGTLVLSNFSGSATGNGSVLIADGATLKGDGSASGSVVIEGSVSPGDVYNPTGSLGLGSTTVNGTVSIDIENSQSDSIFANGSLTLGDSSSLVVTGTLSEPLYQIIPHTGAATGNFASVTIPSGYTLVYGANAISLVSNTAPAYETWAAGLIDASPHSDIDGDGLSNLMEFVLDSNATASSPEDLPTATTTTQGDLVFTFVTKASASYLNPTVEYSTDLASDWQSFAGAVVQTDTPSAGLNTVTATLPASLAAPGTKLFARLRAEMP